MKSYEFIQEGVHDPAIFKVIFVIGGPGSGKSYVVNKLGLSALGYNTINSDIAFEYLMKKHQLDPKMPSTEKEKRDIVRQRAKDITANKSELAIDGKLGLVIDGTGDDYEKIIKLKNNFNALGYNDYLLVVNTKLDVARKRNQARQRTVPDEIVVDSWYAVQNNIGKFAQQFENISIIDNSGDQESTDSQIYNTYKKVVKFTNQQPNKPVARKWIEQQSVTNEASYIGNLGMMEMFKFRELTKNKPELWDLMKKLIAQNKHEEAWKLLQQVTGVKLREAETRTPASTEIRNTLRKKGYKLLGSGVDATVWAKNEGEVIKIIMPDDHQGSGVAGDTFMKFYEFCKQNPNLDNLPKFFGQEVQVFQADGKDYVMVTMERLSPITRHSFQEAMVWILSDLATKRMDWQSALKTMNDETTWDNYGEMPTPDILKRLNSMNRRELLELEVLYKLMVLLYHKGRINKTGWDLHTENAMMRGDTIVITDPWFSSKVEQ